MNLQTMNRQRKYILIAAAVGAIAAFLPWKTVSAGIFGAGISQGISGFHGIGVLAFLVFVAAGILALVGDQTKPLERNAWLAALAAATIAFICALVNIFNTGGNGFGFVEVSIGFGCWIAAVAAVGLGGSAWLFREPGHGLKSNIKQTLPLLVLLIGMAGCKGKPSEKDIKKKILLEYVCAETAEINNLQVLSTKDAEGIFGNKGYEYEVSGEVEWTDGCREFGMRVEPGFTEKFEHKRVFLIKGNDGVWR